MQRGLVGSEMCIRDRYQRRVHGRSTMEKKEGGVEITMITSDSQKLKANYEAMKVCKPIEEFFKDSKPDEEVSLPRVSSGALKKIVEFCEKFQNKSVPQIEKPLKSNKLDVVLKNEWLCKFLDIPTKELYELLMACDYLVLKGLEELVACAVAVKIVGRPIEDIRKEFGIENDFTPDEEKDIKEFFSWADELWPQ
eukprot:TRINITY_DN5361_c0_g1_i3.p1 TRINITY_DN5361_c0_g1~~TRINITY_DN5361_c0_g1_i3.p1  ORF type:complete len:195 (-),score=54.08 TRINITY_DN5361_c0_g1_i3:33-617(-)